MEWREYQESAASFFRSLGMDAAVEERLEGARSTHTVDVAVRFTAFGVQQLWIAECKLWNTAVPKEKVLALKGVLDDVGADRGFLLSESGFQSGAVTAARLSRITLTNLDDLAVNAEEDVQGARWNDLYQRLATCRAEIYALTVITDRADLSSMSILHPGVESEEFFAQIGDASFLEAGLERARLRQFPTMYGGDREANLMYVARDMAEFLDGAEQVLSRIEAWTREQVEKPWPDRPEPAPATRLPDGPTIVMNEKEAAELKARRSVSTEGE